MQNVYTLLIRLSLFEKSESNIFSSTNLPAGNILPVVTLTDEIGSTTTFTDIPVINVINLSLNLNTFGIVGRSQIRCFYSVKI